MRTLGRRGCIFSSDREILSELNDPSVSFADRPKTPYAGELIGNGADGTIPQALRASCPPYGARKVVRAVLSLRYFMPCGNYVACRVGSDPLIAPLCHPERSDAEPKDLAPAEAEGSGFPLTCFT